MSSYKSSTKSASSRSSMSLILGFSKSLEKGSFGVLHCMTKELASFGFKHQYPWGGDAGLWLKKIMSPISHPSDLVGYSGFTIFFWIVVGLLLLGFFNIWYVAYQFYYGKIANIWIIRTLRWFVSFSVAVLFIPIISLLLIGLDCDHSNGSVLRTFNDEFINCFRGANLPIVVVSIVLIVIFSLVAFTSSATYYEYDTNIKSRFAKPHARFDVSILFAKFIFALLHSVVDFKPWLTSIAFFVIMLILTIGSIIILPYNSQRLNQVKSGFYMTVLWISFVTVITMAIDDVTSPATTYLVIVGVFAAFPIGFFSNMFYYKWLTNKISGLQISNNGSLSELEERKRSSSDDQKELPSSKVTWDKQPVTLGSKRQINFPFFQKKLVFSFFVEIMARSLLNESNEGLSSSSAESIERANNLYQCGLQYFPNSDLLWMAYCNFLFTVRKDRHIGYAALEKLRRMKPSFDVRFFIYQRDKEREQIMDSDLRGPEYNGKIQDFVSYMEFKKLYYGAKRYHVKCLTYIKRFWGHLLHETVDLHRLSDLSGRIATTENKANESYERLLALNPNSVRVLRDYSQFLEEVVKDKESSYKLQKKAEAIEEIMSKSQTTDFKFNDIKNVDDSETEVDRTLKQDPTAIRMARIDNEVERKTKSESSKSKDDSSESSSSSKGRKNKYREFQQSNAINKLSWLMIGTTVCCIIFLIVMLVVFRGLEVKHTNAYQGIISITDCAAEAVTVSIALNSMQRFAKLVESSQISIQEGEIEISKLKTQNDRSLIIMKNIHSAIYWGEGDPVSYVGDNLSIIKSRNGFNVFDIGSVVFPYEQFNHSNTVLNNEELVNLYSEPSVQMTILVEPSGVNLTEYFYFSQNYNAWKAGNTFIESAIIANKLSLVELQNVEYNSNFKFVTINGATSIPEIFIKVQQAYIDSLLTDITTTLNTMWYVWLGIFVFLIIIAAVLFRPIVIKISREKIRTLVLFSLAPKDVVVRLSTKKIKMVSLDSGSERDNLFDTTDDDDREHLQTPIHNDHLSDDIGERKKNDDIISISVTERRPLMDSQSVLSATSTSLNKSNDSKLSQQQATNRYQQNYHDDNGGNQKDQKDGDVENKPLLDKKYGWDGKSKRNLNKKSLRSVLGRLHWSYSIAIFLLFGFISMGLWVSYSVVDQNSHTGYILGRSCKRSLDSKIINYHISEHQIEDEIANTKNALDSILDFQANHQSLPYLDDVRPLMEGSLGCWTLDKNQCIQSDSPYYYDASQGLDWLVDKYTKHVLNLVNTHPFKLPTSPDAVWIKEVGSNLIYQGLDTATFIYFKHYLVKQEWATKVLTSILAVSCVILLIVYMVLFRPFMNHLRIQHIHTLALLRLAPDDIRFMEVSDKTIDED